MRDIVLDNFKFILIAFVLVGHVVEPVVWKFEWVKSFYIFIYLFHMPMFAFTSGAVSSRKIDNTAIRSILSKLVIPYVSLEIIYSIFDFFVFSRESLTISPLVPYWILWYLFSLILWRLLLPVFSQFRFPIVFSIVLGLACGLSDYGYKLSFSRTFVFFPFFLIGHYFHTHILENLKRYKVSRLVGAAVFSTIFVLLVFVFEMADFNVAWLYGSRSYSSLGVTWEQGVGYRSGLYLLAFLLGLSILSLVPATHRFYTAFGEKSLYIYVLHGFIMKGLFAVGFYKYINNGPKVVLLMFASLLLLFFLSSRYAKWMADFMMDPFGVTKVILTKSEMPANSPSR